MHDYKNLSKFSSQNSFNYFNDIKTNYTQYSSANDEGYFPIQYTPKNKTNLYNLKNEFVDKSFLPNLHKNRTFLDEEQVELKLNYNQGNNHSYFPKQSSRHIKGYSLFNLKPDNLTKGIERQNQLKELSDKLEKIIKISKNHKKSIRRDFHNFSQIMKILHCEQNNHLSTSTSSSSSSSNHPLNKNSSRIN